MNQFHVYLIKILEKVGKKNTEYNYQIAIISSAPYKELNKKFNQVKEEQQREKEKRLKVLLPLLQ